MKANIFPFKILIVGLGGIGSNLLELVVPVLIRLSQQLELMMDDDLVDESNLAHQRFTQSEIGLAKVDALNAHFQNQPV